MDDAQKQQNRASFQDALNLLAATDDQKIRANTGRWLLLYLEQGNPIPDSLDTTKLTQQLTALRDLDWPKPTKKVKPRKTRSDKGRPRKKS